MFNVSVDTVRSWRNKARNGPRLIRNPTPSDIIQFLNENPRYRDRALAKFAPEEIVQYISRKAA